MLYMCIIAHGIIVSEWFRTKQRAMRNSRWCANNDSNLTNVRVNIYWAWKNCSLHYHIYTGKAYWKLLYHSMRIYLKRTSRTVYQIVGSVNLFYNHRYPLHWMSIENRLKLPGKIWLIMKSYHMLQTKRILLDLISANWRQRQTNTSSKLGGVGRHKTTWKFFISLVVPESFWFITHHDRNERVECQQMIISKLDSNDKMWSVHAHRKTVEWGRR